MTEKTVQEGQEVTVNGIAYTIVDAEYDAEIGLEIVDKSQAKGKYGVGGEIIICSIYTVREWMNDDRG